MAIHIAGLDLLGMHVQVSGGARRCLAWAPLATSSMAKRQYKAGVATIAHLLFLFLSIILVHLTAFYLYIHIVQQLILVKLSFYNLSWQSILVFEGWLSSTYLYSPDMRSINRKGDWK